MCQSGRVGFVNCSVMEAKYVRKACGNKIINANEYNSGNNRIFALSNVKIMNYPLISEYIEAIKFAEENFATLTNLRPVLDEDGQPVMSSGGFAVVFKMKDGQTGKLHAVKCFLKEQVGRAEAYRMIAEELEYVNSTFLTPIKYLDKELFVDSNNSDESEFPVLLMDWVDGETLDKYIREHIDNEYELSLLAYQFSHLAMWLLPQPFAHGDLKPDNILVREDGTLVLVDYDGMYVPAMKGQKARELGSPDFRHPARTETDFNEHIDDFSLVSILLSLKAISLQPGLLEQYGAKDRLLFSERDYRNLSESRIMDTLKAMMQDTELATLYSLFILSASQDNLSQVSFRLLNLSRPKEPEYKNLSIEVTDDDLANAWIDEFGVKYSKDKKRLLKSPRNITVYSVRSGTKVICCYAFHLCHELTSINIPSSVTIIANDVFAECTKLSKISVPNSIKRIGFEAFMSCTSLSSITIPHNIEHIENGLFAGCNHLKTINIPVNIKSIGEYAFSGCSSLITITIPPNVSQIGPHAFEDCCSLTKFSIPQLVKSIENDVFARCFSLYYVSIPSGVKSIGAYAFANCKNLSSIIIPNSVTSIGCLAFVGCISLTSIIIPKSVAEIGGSAFKGCTNLTTITIPLNVKKIEVNPFAGCSCLKAIKVDEQNSQYDSRNGCNAIINKKTCSLIAGCMTTIIPNGVKCIGERAFKGCSSLTSINIPQTVTKIEPGAFEECGGLEKITISDSVTDLDSCTFLNCSSLTTIDIPKSVKSIGFQTFSGCSSLSYINVPDSITFIGSCAFMGCDGLAEISLPDSLIDVGSEIFQNCKSLKCIRIPQGSFDKFKKLLPGYEDLLFEETLSTEVTHEDLVNAWTDEYGAQYSADRKRLLIVPKEISHYPIRKGTVVICDWAFNVNAFLSNSLFVIRNSILTTVRIPDGVKSIGDCAFRNCIALTTIRIPDSVSSIGNRAFSDCKAITNIRIPDGVSSIGRRAFEFCEALTSIRIPDGVPSIGVLTFYYCRALTSIRIPDGVTSIGDCAFSYCDALTSIRIPNSVNSIGEDAFSHCEALTSIHIPVGVTNIGRSAFLDCRALTSIVVDTNNKIYDSRDNCNAIIETKSNTLIAGCRFTVIPNSVTCIGEDAFSHCDALTTIRIPDGVSSIGNHAFCHCDALTTIRIPDSVNNIGEDAFCGCENLSKIIIPYGKKRKFEELLPEFKDKLVEQDSDIK